jgi:hypothetical protein
MMALIQAKCNEYLARLDVGDLRDQFEDASCRNPSLGLRPRQGGCKVRAYK